MKETIENNREAAQQLLRSTEVTAREWSQLLRISGHSSDRRECEKWLRDTYGLSEAQAAVIVSARA